MILKHVDIIGGGIAGLASALSLQTQRIPYTIYEQDSEIKYPTVGLGISQNIFPILKKWDIFEQTFEIGTEIRTMKFADSNLKIFKSFQIKHKPLSVERNTFHKLLYSRLWENSSHLGVTKNIHELDPNHLVIVAEGIDSAIRKAVFPSVKIRSTKQYLFRGICNLDFGSEFESSYIDLVGNNLRFAFIHTGKNSYSWYAVMLNSELPEVNKTKEFLTDIFRKYHPVVLQCINNTERIYHAELRDIDPCSRRNLDWYSGNKVFIGDAIHATTPNLANGACLAMEDADLLSTLLVKHSSKPELAFSQFKKMREPKVNSIVNFSWNLGKSFHFSGPVTDFLMKKSIAITPQFIFNTIYSRVLK